MSSSNGMLFSTKTKVKKAVKKLARRRALLKSPTSINKFVANSYKTIKSLTLRANRTTKSLVVKLNSKKKILVLRFRARNLEHSSESVAKSNTKKRTLLLRFRNLKNSTTPRKVIAKLSQPLCCIANSTPTPTKATVAKPNPKKTVLSSKSRSRRSDKSITTSGFVWTKCPKKKGSSNELRLVTITPMMSPEKELKKSTKEESSQMILYGS